MKNTRKESVENLISYAIYGIRQLKINFYPDEVIKFLIDKYEMPESKAEIIVLFFSVASNFFENVGFNSFVSRSHE